MSFSTFQLTTKFQSLQSQFNSFTHNLANYLTASDLKTLLPTNLDSYFQKFATITDLTNYATLNDLTTYLSNNTDTYITITNPQLHYSIFQSRPTVFLKINEGIDNIVIPTEMNEGQSIQFFNLSKNNITIKSFVPVYNTLYSPNGSLDFVMSPMCTFTFRLVIDSNGQKLFIVN